MLDHGSDFFNLDTITLKNVHFNLCLGDMNGPL